MIVSSDVAYLLIMALLSYSMALSMRVGLFSIAPAGFVVLGAYVFGLLQVRLHWSTYAAGLAAVLACAVVGALVALPLGRIRGVYTSIATLAFVAVATSLESSFGVTGGSLGLVGIPYGDLRAPAVIGIVVVLVLFAYLDHSYGGRRLDVVRRDPVLARTLGANVPLAKFWSLTVSALVAGLAGLLYAREINFIAPTDFDFAFAIMIAANTVLGGFSHWAGPLVGSVGLGLTAIYLRPYVGWSELAYGLILAGVMVWQPLGIAGWIRRGTGYRARRSHPVSAPEPELVESR